MLRLPGPGHVSCHCREPNHDCHYIIPPFRSRPPGLPHTYINKRNPIQNETQPMRTHPHDLISPTNNQCSLGNLTADSVNGETTPPVVGGKTRADTIYTGLRSMRKVKPHSTRPIPLFQVQSSSRFPLMLSVKLINQLLRIPEILRRFPASP